MHPDSILAGLRRELERATDPQHKKDIEAEIKRVDALPRPELDPEQPATVVDRAAGYLAGLKRELERAASERADEIKVEIKRVEALIAGRGKKAAPKVERATAAPGETRGE